MDKTEALFPINLILHVTCPILVTFARHSAHKEHVKGRIMVVVDDAGAAKVINWILSENFYSTRSFRDPARALGEFKKFPGRYVAIIADLRMQGITGFEFARRIRKLSEARIILLTDFNITQSEFARVFPSSKINGIVVKPTSPRQLMQALTGLSTQRPGNEHIGEEKQEHYQESH